MNKKVAQNLVIYKDPNSSAGLYLSCLIYLIFFAISFVWLIGTFTEFYQADHDFVMGTIVLSFFSLLFGWRLVSKILAVIDLNREKPLITISIDGIAILDDKFRAWTEIRQLRLVTNFNIKYIELEGVIPGDDINYMLYSPADTHEFKHLLELKNILDRYTDIVIISEC